MTFTILCLRAWHLPLCVVATCFLFATLSAKAGSSVSLGSIYWRSSSWLGDQDSGADTASTGGCSAVAQAHDGRYIALGASLSALEQWLMACQRVDNQPSCSKATSEDVACVGRCLLRMVFLPLMVATGTVRSVQNSCQCQATCGALTGQTLINMYYVLQGLIVYVHFGHLWQYFQTMVMTISSVVAVLLSATGCSTDRVKTLAASITDKQHSQLPCLLLGGASCTRLRIFRPLTAAVAGAVSSCAMNICKVLGSTLAALHAVVLPCTAVAVNTAITMQSAAETVGIGDAMHPAVYKTIVSASMISIKVIDADHSNMPMLSPPLIKTVKQHAMTATAATGGDTRFGPLAPAQVDAVCFHGCVQLLASVYSIDASLIAALQGHHPPVSDSHPQDQSDSSNSGSGSDNSSSRRERATSVWFNSPFVATLLASVRSKLAECGISRHSGSSFDDTLLPDVQVAVGKPSAWSSGSTAAPVTAAGLPGARVVCCQPCCLVAEQGQQQLRLMMKAETGVSSASTAAPGVAAGNISTCAAVTGGIGMASMVTLPCRLLAYQEGKVVIDEDVVLTINNDDEDVADISISLPHLKEGILQVALLPGSKPSTSARQYTPDVPAQGMTPAPFAPMLVQPLLVLPQAAASEMVTLWQPLLTATAGTAPAGGSDGEQGTACTDFAAAAAAAAAWTSITDLATDLAYVVTATRESTVLGALPSAAAIDNSTAAGGGGGGGVAYGNRGVGCNALAAAASPDAAKAVLSNICSYLGSHQLWDTLAAVVQLAASNPVTATMQ